MLNNLVIAGRITKVPQFNKTGETSICNFDIAVDNIRKEKDGTRGTTFLPVVCFGRVADNVAQYCSKGSKVAVVGNIQQRNFLRKDGTKGSVYEVYADSVEFLDPKEEEPAEPNPDELVGEPLNAQAPKYDPMTGKPLNPESK